MSDKPLRLFKNLNKCEICGNVYSTKQYTGCPVCSGIRFENIESVKIIDKEDAYEIREEFECDFLKSDFYSSLDNHPHYEGEWVGKEVRSGKDITFYISYKDSDYDIMTLNSSLPVCKRLMLLAKKNR